MAYFCLRTCNGCACSFAPQNFCCNLQLCSDNVLIEAFQKHAADYLIRHAVMRPVSVKIPICSCRGALLIGCHTKTLFALVIWPNCNLKRVNYVRRLGRLRSRRIISGHMVEAVFAT